jgi:hypothetical protein
VAELEGEVEIANSRSKHVSRIQHLEEMLRLEEKKVERAKEINRELRERNDRTQAQLRVEEHSNRALTEELRLAKEEIKKIEQRFKKSDSGNLVLKAFKKEILEAFICPISFSEIKDPVILPCGQTIDSSTMSNLIASNFKDPFTNSERCTKKVPNYLAKAILEIVSSYTD